MNNRNNRSTRTGDTATTFNGRECTKVTITFEISIFFHEKICVHFLDTYERYAKSFRTEMCYRISNEKYKKMH